MLYERMDMPTYGSLRDLTPLELDLIAVALSEKLDREPNDANTASMLHQVEEEIERVDEANLDELLLIADARARA